MTNRTFVPWSDDDGEFRERPESNTIAEPATGMAGTQPANQRSGKGERRARYGWAFYLLSATLHVAAALALSRSWMRQESVTQDVPPAPVPTVERMPVAKIEIDVAPVKYCELDIHALTGQRPIMSRLVPVTPSSSSKKPSATRPRRRHPLGSGSLSQTPVVLPPQQPAALSKARKPSATIAAAVDPITARSNLLQDSRP